MKLSRMRAKARSAFARGRVQYRWDADGRVHDAQPLSDPTACVEVVVIRGRAFTRPQCAEQDDR